MGRALAGFHRVLKPGGRALIAVPDFEGLCRLFLDPRANMLDRFQIMRMVFGAQMDEHDFHYVGLSYEFLSQFLFQSGFSRVERVQDISEADSESEGVDRIGSLWRGYGADMGVEFARTSFRLLWDSINGKRPGCAWSDNPWVWVVSFRRAAQ